MLKFVVATEIKKKKKTEELIEKCEKIDRKLVQLRRIDFRNLFNKNQLE